MTVGLLVARRDSCCTRKSFRAVQANEETALRLMVETVQADGGDRMPYLKTLSAARIRRATVLL